MHYKSLQSIAYRSKLVFVNVSHFHASLIFADKTKAYRQCLVPYGPGLWSGRLQALPINHSFIRYILKAYILSKLLVMYFVAPIDQHALKKCKHLFEFHHLLLIGDIYLVVKVLIYISIRQLFSSCIDVYYLLFHS